MRQFAALAVVLVLGCGSPSPRTHFYTLSAEAAPAGARGPVVSIWQVSIPEVVDRTQMVVRVDANKVDIADYHRWAEPLRRGVPRALAENLAARLPGHVVVAGQPAGLSPEVRIGVDVQKFEAVLGKAVTVDALWTVRPAKGEARAGRSSVTEPVQGGDHAAVAAAYSRALARISQDLAAAVSAE